jgi:hypothetical protein
MRTDYSDQLNNIERAFQEERVAILKRNEDEVKQLFDDHGKLEEHY